MDFDNFVEYVFNRRFQGVEWYFLDEHEDVCLPDIEIAVLSAEIFRRIELISQSYTEVQFCMGLSFLVNPSCSPCANALLDEGVPIELRTAAISNMYGVFSKVFSQKCVQEVPFGELALQSTLNYETVCYMWWDVFPRHGVPSVVGMREVDNTIIETLEKTLLIRNFACTESALHGLGHWHGAAGERIESFILDRMQDFPAKLVDYAQKACRGAVQ